MITLAFMLALDLVAHAGHDQKIAPADLPPAIIKALNTRYPGARVVKAEREEKNTKVSYEVKACHEGRKIEVEFNSEGVITDVEDEGRC